MGGVTNLSGLNPVRSAPPTAGDFSNVGAHLRHSRWLLSILCVILCTVQHPMVMTIVTAPTKSPRVREPLSKG